MRFSERTPRRRGGVYLAQPTLPPTREVVSAIERTGGPARPVPADVSRAEEVQRRFGEAQRPGGVDIAVANAGVTMSRPFAETHDEDYEQMFAVNTLGTGGTMMSPAGVITRVPASELAGAPLPPTSSIPG